MFQLKTHQSQLLEPKAYCGDQFLAQEKAQIFEPAWHYVGSLDELAAEGDYFTCELLDRPIIVWRQSGQVRAFLNVCSHRFSKLTSQERGCTQRLVCQYHGWEYDQCGATQRIPDAQSFRPLKDAELGLRRLDVATCGSLVFVSLNSLHQNRNSAVDIESSQRSLAEQLGDSMRAIESMYSPRVKLIYSMQQTVEANWKLIVENAVESYHVSCVHADSFQTMPPAESCNHKIASQYSSFETNAPSQAPRTLQLAERLVHRLIGMPHEERYVHFLCYPNLMVSTSKLIVAAMTVQPRTPRSSTFKLQVFANRGRYDHLAAKIALWCAGKFAVKEIGKILNEDFAILPSIQAGISSPDHPTGGLISCREERVLHFQKMVHEACLNS